MLPIGFAVAMLPATAAPENDTAGQGRRGEADVGMAAREPVPRPGAGRRARQIQLNGRRAGLPGRGLAGSNAAARGRTGDGAAASGSKSALSPVAHGGDQRAHVGPGCPRARARTAPCACRSSASPA